MKKKACLTTIFITCFCHICLQAAEPLVSAKKPIQKQQRKIKTYRETILGTKITFEMVFVPAGTFQYFLDNGESRMALENMKKMKRQKVALSGYWIGQCEVTNELFNQWAERLDQKRMEKKKANGKKIDPRQLAASKIISPGKLDRIKREGRGTTIAFNDAQRPVEMTSCYSAQTFCRWLSARTGKFYRLPTDAEWQYAARAGTIWDNFAETIPSKKGSRKKHPLPVGLNPDGTIPYAWCWGPSHDKERDRINKLDKLSEASKKSMIFSLEPRRTRAVKMGPPNPWGLHDMHGNVQEWIADYFPYKLNKNKHANRLPFVPKPKTMRDPMVWPTGEHAKKSPLLLQRYARGGGIMVLPA